MMRMRKKERSDFCWSVDEETWCVNSAGVCCDKTFDGPYKTRDAALAAAKASHPGAAMWHTAECVWQTNGHFFDADDILDRIADLAASEIEDPDSYPDVSKEGTKELQALLDAWTAKHLPNGPNWYECHDVVDHEAP